MHCYATLQVTPATAVYKSACQSSKSLPSSRSCRRCTRTALHAAPPLGPQLFQRKPNLAISLERVAAGLTCCSYESAVLRVGDRHGQENKGQKIGTETRASANTSPGKPRVHTSPPSLVYPRRRVYGDRLTLCNAAFCCWPSCI